MKSFKTKQRQAKITGVLSHRQHSFKIVLENIHDPHNVSAIFRTCDAAGIPVVSLLYNVEPFPKIGKKSSASALKWIQKEKYTSVEECYSKLREDGFEIYASALEKDSIDLYKLDLTKKIAVIVGNENRGVSVDALKLADKKFYIPMFGMVQSLNVSVAAAITIYEAVRQRIEAGKYDKNDINTEIYESLLEAWNKK